MTHRRLICLALAWSLMFLSIYLLVNGGVGKYDAPKVTVETCPGCEPVPASIEGIAP